MRFVYLINPWGINKGDMNGLGLFDLLIIGIN